ncbi:hypothetical protein N7462_011125 [Penicillium macrosclerotiorum]|uniref:uncharacterized protein n=1 Tax=Penicillium macrosclerotiorum TaxID=303699 RepID=UPI002547A8C1|nr:uncharacterized protein N7462_011125 [Penicillium macrosclerotiorum]KAJ5666716.1 hypothetical protein N7462_011125 [Penicillium macrosclerotiorum]
MALVAYSDSEGSDAEPDTTPIPATDKAKKPESGPGFQIDRSNPRKIRVALPELKPEHTTSQDSDDGPARKKARLGGASGGAFSAFNSLLPAPKRAAEKKAPLASTRKVFSLKTGATPGFDREADAEFKCDQTLPTNAEDMDGEGETIPKAGSLGQASSNTDGGLIQKTESGEVKLQGNPMMFRPLSVARNQKKKKTTKASSQSIPPATSQQSTAKPAPTSAAPVPQAPKPKVSLFSLSSEDTAPERASVSESYEPLVYNAEPEDMPTTLAAAPDSVPVDAAYYPTNASVSSSLNNIANDLNLSKSERRQLFGRNAPSAESQILTFNTDKEYAHNQALAETELAGTQHNPVRAIAPGKHSLQQLVNAATSQKDALEESFASGRRKQKEAGSRYGW